MNFNNKIFKKISNEKGISLIELVVAVSVFSLVITTASGIFINAIKAQKVIAAKQNVAENTRYIMEFMVKELRMAQENINPDLTFTDAAGSKAADNFYFDKITFVNGSGDTISYSFSGNKIYREINGGGAVEFSSGEVDITSLSFAFNDWDLEDGPAPLIAILIKARAKSGVGGEMEMQTSVSPRIY